MKAGIYANRLCNEMENNTNSMSAIAVFLVEYFHDIAQFSIEWTKTREKDIHYVTLRNVVPKVQPGAIEIEKSNKRQFFSFVVPSPDYLPETTNGKLTVTKFVSPVLRTSREIFTDIFTMELLTSSKFYNIQYDTDDPKEIKDAKMHKMSMEKVKQINKRRFHINNVRFAYAVKPKDVQILKGDKQITEKKDAVVSESEHEKLDAEIESLLNKWKSRILHYIYGNAFRTMRWGLILKRSSELDVDAIAELKERLNEWSASAFLMRFKAFLENKHKDTLYKLYMNPVTDTRLCDRNHEVGKYEVTFPMDKSVHFSKGNNNNLYGEFAFANMNLRADDAGIMADFFKRCWEIRNEDPGGEKLMEVDNFEEYLFNYIKEKKRKIREKKERRKTLLPDLRLLQKLKKIPDEVRKPIMAYQMRSFLEVKDEEVEKIVEGFKTSENRRFLYLDNAKNNYLKSKKQRAIENEKK